MIFNSLSIAQMQQLAQIVAGSLTSGDVVTLSGEVGSGKTTFARALIQHLSAGAPEITSPTFNLMQSYDVTLGNGAKETLWHLDLYRLKNKAEAEELGLSELLPHITVIEWPELIQNMLPANHLNIAFDFGRNQETRTLVISGNEAWQNKLKNKKTTV